jgi:hypothetical protein
VSGNPPQSYVSPDGNYYWDGQKWVPMQQPARAEAPPANQQAWSVQPQASDDQQAWSPAEDSTPYDPNEPITIGSRSRDGQWWWDGKRWNPVDAPIPGAQAAQPSAQPSALPATAAVLGAGALTAGFAWRQQLGGAAGWSIGLGLASMIAPLTVGFFFPIMPLIGFLNAFRAIQRGRLIGGVIGIVLNALGGLVTLFASGIIFR